MPTPVVQRRLQIVIDESGADRALKKLQASEAELVKTIDKYTKAGKDATKETENLAATRGKIDQLQKVIGGQLAPSFKQAQAAATNLRRELERMSKDAPGYSEKLKKLGEVEKVLEQSRAKVVETRGALQDVFGGSFLAGLALQATNSLRNIASKVLDTGVQFEKFEAVLTVALGSESAAAKALENLSKFAAETPFQLTELTESFVKLVNRGFKPTNEELRNIGDLAASQGKSFDQLVEAILDAQTGEFERLKEFGIKARSEGDKVSIAFRGQNVEIEKTEEAIRNAILAFGELEGVTGTMAKVSETTGGQLSNLTDKLDALYNKIFEKAKSSIDSAVAGFSRLVDVIGEFFDGTDAAVKKYEEAQRGFDKTQQSIKPLVDRYIELKSQTQLNAAEQEELKNVIQDIARVIPEAVTAFDQYGNALDINADRFAEFIGRQRQFVQDLNADAIGDLQSDLDVAIRTVRDRSATINQILAQENQEAYKGEVQRFQREIAQNKDIALKAATELQQKFGVELPEAIQESLAAIRESIGVLPTITLFLPEEERRRQDEAKKAFEQRQKDQEEAAKKAQEAGRRAAEARQRKAAADAKRAAEEQARNLRDVLRTIAGIQQQLYVSELDPYLASLENISAKYDELFRKSGADALVRQQVLQTLLRETVALNKKFREEMDKAALQVPPELAGQRNDDFVRGPDLQLKQQERLAKAELAVLNSTGTAKILAQRRFLDEQRDLEIGQLRLLAAERGESEESVQQQILLVRTKFAQQAREEETQTVLEGLQQSLDTIGIYVEQYAGFSDAMNQLDQTRLQTIEAGYRRDEDRLKNLLKNKLISQEEYTRRSEILEKKLDKERAEIARRQHRRQQVASVAEILMNAASGAIRLWAQPGFPANIPLLALLAVQTGLQTAAVLKSKPPSFAKGGILPEGPSHADGGMAIVSRGQKVAEIEGGEPIISKPVYRANKHLVDQLLAKGHAHDFAPIAPAWYGAAPVPMNIPAISSTMVRIPRYADGGLLPDQPTNNQRQGTDTAVMVALLERLRQPIVAQVVYTEIEARGSDINDIRDSGFLN